MSTEPTNEELAKSYATKIEQAQERREAKDQERLERHGQAAALASQNIEAEQPKAKQAGVVCGRGRNPTLRLWPTIFSGKIDVFPGDRRSRLISSMTSVAPA